MVDAEVARRGPGALHRRRPRAQGARELVVCRLRQAVRLQGQRNQHGRERISRRGHLVGWRPATRAARLGRWQRLFYQRTRTEVRRDTAHRVLQAERMEGACPDGRATRLFRRHDGRLARRGDTDEAERQPRHGPRGLLYRHTVRPQHVYVAGRPALPSRLHHTRLLPDAVPGILSRGRHAIPAAAPDGRSRPAVGPRRELGRRHPGIHIV